MDLLRGPTVHVILHVKEGRGFGFLEHPVSLCVEANLNGHLLSTEVVTTLSADIVFDAELLWEAEKKALRRLRSANIPLKVECYEVVNDKKKRVGFVPINLRGAQIVLPGNSVEVSSSWYTLLDTGPEAKGHHPQLLFGCRVTDSPRPHQGIDMIPHGNHILNVFPHTKGQFTPELLEDEGIIQIGPTNVATDMFLFTICVGQAAKLELLADMDQLHADSFYFTCKVMGYTIQAGTFSDLASFTTNTCEKIVIRIRSSMQILKVYFTEMAVVTLRLMLGQREIAFSDIDITLLVPTYDLTAFCTQYAVNNTMGQQYQCFLAKSQTGEIPIGLDGSRPYATIILKLKYVNLGDAMTFAQGDAKKLHASTSSISLPIQSQVASRGDLGATQPKSLVQSHRETSSEPIPNDSSHNADHCFSLDINLKSILFYKMPPQKKITFRFSMSKATVTPVLQPEFDVEHTNVNIHLKGVTCMLKLRVTVEELHRQLLTDPPVVTVCAILGEAVVPFLCTSLDMGLLLLKEQKDCCYTAALRDLVTSEGYGVLVVSMVLDDSVPVVEQSQPYKTSPTEHELIRPTMDDAIAYKIVEELEEWKDRQEQLFKAELKKKEKTYMDSVVASWEIRHRSFESSMNCGVEHCSKLAKQLSETTESLRIKTESLARRELELNHLEKTLQQEYHLKVQELREDSRRLDDDNGLKTDFNIPSTTLGQNIESSLSQPVLNGSHSCMKISKLELKEKELLVRVASLEKDLQLARDTVQTQEKELTKLNKSSLTQDQTATLLQELKSVEEKLECALRSKTFFKEQWARAVREIHRIKSEHQQALQIQIKHNREELQRLGLQHLLIGNEKEMNGDKAALQKVRTELNNVRACMAQGDALSEKTTVLLDQEHFSRKSSSSIKLTSSATHLDDTEQQLEQLVQERDSLLNTGNYTLDDAVVVKLNQEIRRLLIESNGNT